MAAWWLPALNDEGLSQGDVLKPLPQAVSVFPTRRLQRKSLKGAPEAYVPTEDTSRDYFLFRGAETEVLIISHSCDLDKNERKQRVLVSPIFRLDIVSKKDVRETILAQRRISLMPLPDLPELGDCYADLRLISSVPREFLTDERRLASMSEEGVVRLQVQLAYFLFRIPPGTLDKMLREGERAQD